MSLTLKKMYTQLPFTIKSMEYYYAYTDRWFVPAVITMAPFMYTRLLFLTSISWNLVELLRHSFASVHVSVCRKIKLIMMFVDTHLITLLLHL